MPPPLTTEQQAAVAATGDVLVVAGAGTGKTSTLVARVLDRVCDAQDRVSMDRILMVTFTELAADEMRSRLREAIAGRLDADPGNHHLEEQSHLLEKASIGTLHRFCGQLVREHFHELSLDPQLATLEPGEAHRLATQVLDEVLHASLDPEEPAGKDLRDLTVNLLGGDPDRLADVVLDIFHYARSLPDPDSWIAAQRAAWAEPTSDRWRADLHQELADWAADWVARLANPHPENTPALRCRQLLQSLPAQGDRNGTAALLDQLEAVDTGSWPPRRKTEFRKPLADLFTDIRWFRSWLPSSEAAPDPLDAAWELCRHRLVALFDTVQTFAATFAETKRQLAVLDFADLEQFALRLLGPGETPAARHCRERFDHVFVDECQDLNAAQSAILRAVSREGGRANRFLVGDVKQSIYRFRLADPHIFQQLTRDLRAQESGGRVLLLTENFRSAEAILDFVNATFTRLFRGDLGGVDYDHEAMLRFGAPAERSWARRDGSPRVEMHFIRGDLDDPEPRAGEDQENGEAELQSTEMEARWIAWHVGVLLREGRLPTRENPEGRPITPSDIAVLLRSPSGRDEIFAREFQRRGIPLAVPPGPFASQRETRDILAVLHVLDNPFQDIPLAAVMRSPFGLLTNPNELAVIRLAAKRAPLWTALQAFCAATGASPATAPDQAVPSPDDAGVQRWTSLTRPKALALRDRLLSWRDASRRGSMLELVETILDDAGYEAAVGGHGGASQRLANIRFFLDAARRFDMQHRGGLSRFLGFLEAEEEGGLEAPSVNAGDAVRLLSIHKSKGLEFPIVILAGLGTAFNLRDLDRPILRDDKHGVCPLVVTDGGDRFASPPLRRAVRRQRREALAEEMRLLYVACTRAGERLLMWSVASEAHLERWLESGPGPLPTHELLKARKPIDWMAPVLAALGQPPDWLNQWEGTSDLFRWQVHPATTPDPGIAGPSFRTRTITPAATAPLPDVRVSYPHAAATREAAKQTVTGLRRRMDSADSEVHPAFTWVQAGNTDESPGTHTLDARRRGTAVHRFLELLDLEKTSSRALLESERQRLEQGGWLAPEEAGAIDVDAVHRFWNSPLGVALQSARSGIRREWPFTVRMTSADLGALNVPCNPGLAPDEFIVVQGIVDLAALTPDGIWLVDFKTDRVDAQSARSRAELYRPQLGVYAMALERILGQPVVRRSLHFLEPGVTVDLDKAPAPPLHTFGSQPRR